MTILIIDDESLVRRSLMKTFKMLGHQVFEAENGKEGLKKWYEVDPDIVMLDVLMPEMSGPEVLQNIVGKTKAKIALMSAYTGDNNKSTATEMGAHMFIAKPFDNIFDVANKVLELIDG